MNAWREHKIKDIAHRITSGGTPKTSVAEYYNGNIPWLKTQEVNFNRILDTETKITEKGLKESSAKIIEKNSVVVAMYGVTAGRVAINKIDLSTNQACCNITPNPDLCDYQYLFYYLSYRYDELVNLSTGAAQQNLNLGHVANFPIFLPPMKEQKAIAEVLSSLDDKIDLLHRNNRTLENMAETLFQQFLWAGSTESLPLVAATECFILVGGGTPATTESAFWGGKIKWMSAKDITAAHKGFILNTEKTITNLGLEKSSTKMLPKFATVISARGTVGKYCMLPEPMCFSQSNYGILPVDAESFFFTYLLVASLVRNLQAASYGTVFDTITTRTFSEIRVPSLPQGLIKKFNESVSPLFEKMLLNSQQIESLSKMRDYLLPKLLSGNIVISSEIFQHVKS